MLGRTKIYYLHGANEQLKDAPKAVATKRVFNYHLMSEGEFLLSLLDYELDIARQYYGDNDGNFQFAKNLIYQAINNGLHAGLGVGRYAQRIPDQLNFVVQKIRAAKYLNKPAGDVKLKTNAFISGPGDLLNPDTPLISAEDCTKYLNLNNPESGNVATQDYYDCLNRNKFISLLNEKWEESSHHVLYEFLSQQQALGNNIAAAKQVLQKIGIDGISNVTKLKRSNLSEWARLGIIRSSLVAGIEPIDPQETISHLIEAGQSENPNIPSVKAPFSIPLAIKIVGLLVTAIKAADAIKRTLSQNSEQAVQQTLKDFGSVGFSANKDDWSAFGGTGGGNIPGVDISNSNSNTPLLLAGVAVAFMALKK